MTQLPATVLNSWGPGKFDASLFLDGKAFRPDGKTAATLIPPAFGLAGVNLGTWTGFGSTTYWNAFVANLEMHGKGTFYDPRLNDARQFPVAAQGRLRQCKEQSGSHYFQSSPHCTFINSASPRRSRPKPVSRSTSRPSVGRTSSMAKRNAHAAMFRRCLRSRDSTYTRRMRLASTTFRPSARPPGATGPRR